MDQRVKAELEHEEKNHVSLAFMHWVRNASRTELEAQLRFKESGPERYTWEPEAIRRELRARGVVTTKDLQTGES